MSTMRALWIISLTIATRVGVWTLERHQLREVPDALGIRMAVRRSRYVRGRRLGRRRRFRGGRFGGLSCDGRGGDENNAHAGQHEHAHTALQSDAPIVYSPHL